MHDSINTYSSVWQDWIVENDTFVGMKFVMGEQCGAVDREAQVSLIYMIMLLVMLSYMQ